MKKKFSVFSPACIYFSISLLVSFILISKIFFISNCFPFDQTDDANHTFVNLTYIKDALKQGQWPLINLYNNFGTPIIGDVLTYPLAFHSLTYLFFPPEIAMGVNRFVIIFLTIFLLCYHFKSKMSPFACCLSALFVVLSPGFIWHAAHHHYQSAIFFFCLGLIIQERMHEKKAGIVFLVFSLFFIFLFQNTSLNLVILMVVFWFVNELILVKKKNINHVLLFCASLLVGILFYWKDLYYFYEMMTQSIRVEQWYLPPHLTITTRFPIFVFGMALLSFRWFIGSKDKTRYTQVFVLGLCPLAIVVFLKNNVSVWEVIPLLKSVDISRLWWVSNIFLALGLGLSFDKIFLMKERRWKYFLIIYGLLFIEIFSFIIGWQKVFRLNYTVLLFVLAVGLIALLMRRIKLIKNKLSPAIHYVLMGGIFISTMMYFVLYMIGFIPINSCDSGHYFSRYNKSFFSPRMFLEYIKPYSRLAVDLPSYTGLDIKAGRDHLLGSTGRSVFLNKEFTMFLFNEGLIEPDQNPAAYHFKSPWSAQKLRMLGISYVMQKGLLDDDIGQDWKLLVQENGYSLYKNRLPVSLVYFYDSQGRYVAIPSKDIKVGINTVSVKLPSRKEHIELVATWQNLSGWKVYVDGDRKDFVEREDRLLRVGLDSQKEKVVFKFQPF